MRDCKGNMSYGYKRVSGQAPKAFLPRDLWSCLPLASKQTSTAWAASAHLGLPTSREASRLFPVWFPLPQPDSGLLHPEDAQEMPPMSENLRDEG